MLGCGAHIKQNQLYISTTVADTTNPEFYASSEIYHDYLTSEAWFTMQDHCVTVKAVEEATYEGDLGMHIKWDRQAAGCPWLGLGFGWDNWTGKDLSEIKNEAAIEFWVRMIEGERDNLPWAIGIEDFTGSQAWLGMTTNAIKAENISTTWTRIELPLSEFNWAEQNANPSSVKQIIFNMEGEGEIYMDEIKIVPYKGGYRKRAQVPILASNQFKVDGIKDDDIWLTEEITFGKNIIHLALIDSFLCVALEVKDSNPLENEFTGDQSFDGDALELAFSTDPNAVLQRIRYLSTDQHIGFALGDEISSWNWRKHNSLTQTKGATQLTDDGYVFEVMINIHEFGIESFSNNSLYGLEIAVDHGNKKGRVNQERWNDKANGGFYENPFLWGEMIFHQNIVELKHL
jgi:hypothetical protein